MKKIIVTTLAVVVAVGAFAQGTITLNNRVSGVLVVPIYNPDPLNIQRSVQGNATTNGGSTDWTGFTGVSGTNFTAQLFGGPQGTAFDSLQPVLPSTPFRTGAAAGYFSPATGTVPGVGSTVNGGGIATLQLRAWDNQGGTITSWAQVLGNPTILHGSSPTFDSQPLGGGLITSPNLIGLQSFNLFAVPEPSVIALGVLGVGALLLRRRKTA